MVLTVPLGTQRRLTVAVTLDHGVHAASWRRDHVQPYGRPEDDGGPGGVREPRRPAPLDDAGAVALALD